ncbi:MAG TPA: ATP-binding cassette domain-containing protein [Actinomycetota bacterium]|nr:ATP-binding cassette domain-containing protein [Actinomycetota bacterium]
MPPGLQLIDLRRRFGDVVALDGVSFDVDEGSVVGFVGPNGARKTTAMRIALGVLEADGGEVRWRGRAVDASARRWFGYIPEERGLSPKMRVLDQVVYLARLHGSGRAAASARGLEILETLANVRTVAEGAIGELRASRARRLVRIEVVGATVDWYETIPGLRPACSPPRARSCRGWRSCRTRSCRSTSSSSRRPSSRSARSRTPTPRSRSSRRSCRSPRRSRCRCGW